MSKENTLSVRHIMAKEKIVVDTRVPKANEIVIGRDNTYMVIGDGTNEVNNLQRKFFIPNVPQQVNYSYLGLQYNLTNKNFSLVDIEGKLVPDASSTSYTSNTQYAPKKITSSGQSYWSWVPVTGGSSINVVQTTGQSTTDVMSQKAVTDKLNTKMNNICTHHIILTATNQSRTITYHFSFDIVTDNFEFIQSLDDITFPEGEFQQFPECKFIHAIGSRSNGTIAISLGKNTIDNKYIALIQDGSGLAVEQLDNIIILADFINHIVETE